jgi:hypothetical protein
MMRCLPLCYVRLLAGLAPRDRELFDQLYGSSVYVDVEGGQAWRTSMYPTATVGCCILSIEYNGGGSDLPCEVTKQDTNVRRRTQ